MPAQTLHQPWMKAPATVAVMQALAAKGGADAARYVGGCVRDAILGREIHDIDIATRLAPDEVIAALKAAGLKAVPTGVEHGTVTAISGGKPFEVTTLRRDVETDGRRAVVAFTQDWAEDAARRDFRLNALYLQADGTLRDPLGAGGEADAHAGRIVFVGDAEGRIREDYLRILRFFRFFAWYGQGEPDAEGLAACARLAEGVSSLSGERLQKELMKLLAAPEPGPAVRLMDEAGVLRAFLPGPANLARLEGMAALSNEPVLRLAALLPDDPEALVQAATRLRLSNADRDRLIALAPNDRAAPGGSPEAARRALYALGAQAVRDRALVGAAGGGTEDWSVLLHEAGAWTKPVFPAKGADVAALGVPAGPLIGRVLQAAERWWIDHDFRPGRDAVLAKLYQLAQDATGPARIGD